MSYAFETSATAGGSPASSRRSPCSRTSSRSERYDGRVYLVKNVYASQETLRAMYGEHAIGAPEVKRELDPDRLLVNDFLERTFGELADEVYAGATTKPRRSALRPCPVSARRAAARPCARGRCRPSSLAVAQRRLEQRQRSRAVRRVRRARGASSA